MDRNTLRGIMDEGDLIRQEVQKMSEAQLEEELKVLVKVAPNSQKTALYSMELQVRKLWKKAGKEKAAMFGR